MSLQVPQSLFLQLELHREHPHSEYWVFSQIQLPHRLGYPSRYPVQTGADLPGSVTDFLLAAAEPKRMPQSLFIIIISTKLSHLFQTTLIHRSSKSTLNIYLYCIT